MTEREILKRKVHLVLMIKQLELDLPRDESGVVAESCLPFFDYETPLPNLDSFARELSEHGIIEITDRWDLSHYIDGEEAFHEDGTPFLSDEKIYRYKNVNLDKLEEYIKPLLSSFTEDEIKEMKKYPQPKPPLGYIRLTCGKLRIHEGGVI